ncbi:hypothetical protein AOQ84DRAFT_288325 [Glonium stellatum]|uniref:G-protein coupled receptors family 2 profile 2 domain-containing protein n=1 Tax=Glonium stellatum TaxID=574774 RepID=A0A8E2JV82_9PEZI|nr:hypothetical protein AOQ84DRAFT_288325 [Glonium stellatum]
MPSYFPYPDSLDPLPDQIRKGLIPVGCCALLSVVATFLLLCWLTCRLVCWRQHYHTYVGYNQYVLLIFNLLLADFQQSLGFLITFHWIKENRIVAPTAACFAQSWLLHIGDVSSGFFVLAIAIHTWLAVIKGYKMSYTAFVTFVLVVWGLSVLLTLIGPALHGNLTYTRAGVWCWISTKYETERLWLHYLWIFIDEFGTILIYGSIFFYLRGQLKNIPENYAASSNRLTKATRYMIMYPMIYAILTLPIAAGRMAAMTGRVLPDMYYCVAGSLLTSCGWLDALLYTLTRQVLISSELDSAQKSYSRTAEPTNATGWEIYSLKKDIRHGARTVTITGGGDGGERDRDISPSERKRFNREHLRRSSSASVQDPSPLGSTDSIIKPAIGWSGVKAETKVEITIEHAHESDQESSRR